MELLETLAYRCGCDFLSDLNFRCLKKDFPPLLPHIVRHLLVEKWNCEEWRDAVHYITGEKIQRESQADYQAYLLNDWQMGRQHRPGSRPEVKMK
ncbi:MAG: hypothetical protein Q4B48_08270 [Syntrophomonadaceae bacterium]|nr:hypothetical protein [Syntrophomonadaceae bacterium]